MARKPRQQFVREQHRDAILHRLVSRANGVIRRLRARGVCETELHTEWVPLLDEIVERVYRRLADRHPERIGL